jgi:hypothetical protein
LRTQYFASRIRAIRFTIFAAYGQYDAEVLKEQFDHIVKYRPAPAANRTAHNYEESLGYTSGFAHSKTDHEHGTSQGENEQKIPLLPAHETKLLKPKRVIVQIDGERSTIAQRLDWRDVPELVRRAAIAPPPVPSLPHVEQRLPQKEQRKLPPLAAWHFDSNLFRRWRPAQAESGGGEQASP